MPLKHQDWYVVDNIHTNTIEGFWALLKMFGISQREPPSLAALCGRVLLPL